MFSSLRANFMMHLLEVLLKQIACSMFALLNELMAHFANRTGLHEQCGHHLTICELRCSMSLTSLPPFFGPGLTPMSQQPMPLCL